MSSEKQIQNPYFEPSMQGTSSYLTEALEAIDTLKPFLSRKQLTSLQNDKLQLYKDKINEVQYLQAACELTICSYFAKHFPGKFKYEPQPSPPKDVECSYEDGGYLINVEVKCADFTKKHAVDKKDVFSMGALGRVPDFEKLMKDLEPIMNSGPLGKPLLVQPHMDNKLKDFLLSAQSKFSDTPSPTALNVLAVCCDSPSDMQKWFYYMYGNEGLFMQDSYVEQSQYNKVDVVLLTNLYHRHYDYPKKDQIKNHWDLAQSFNLVCFNPFQMLDKQGPIKHFANSVPNYSDALSKYEVPGDAPTDVRDALRISHFVLEKLQAAGHFHFPPAARESN
jgi:hypothetical protein